MCNVFGRIGKGRSTSIGIILLGMSACGPLDPIIVEREMPDLQLTVDTLKTSLRDAQRTVAELRAEIDAGRQELADVQIVRAQLEGRIREAERRLTEARHVIDLQREELANSRSEREQVGRTKAALQNKLQQLQKRVSKVEGNVPSEALRIQVVVKSGDTLWRIARRHRTSVRRLMVRNALSNEHIQVGQALWLTEPPIEGPGHERM